VSGPIVAIDGPAGSGKSTLAKRLALALDLPHVNTGTTYRAVAREALRRGADPADGTALEEIARSLRFTIEEPAPPRRVFVNGAPPGDELRTPEVEGIVSEVSRHPEVRAALREVQRRLGEDGAVMEGRDIGTVVYPEAEVKMFLHADPEERAARRQAELGEEELTRAVAHRDALDARTNPFVPAPDALVVDTSGRSADEIFEEVLALVRERLPGRG
jgi:cytidylate kinase